MVYNYLMSQPVGFQKLAFAPRVTGALVGAGLGALSAPKDHGWEGAALGGLTGYGIGALGSRAAGLFRRTPRTLAPAGSITNPARLLPGQVTPATPPASGVVMGPHETIPQGAKKVGFAKLADVGMSFGLPGVGGINVAGKDERLTGMNRWVPRSTLERAYQGLEQGYDEPALYEQAVDEGTLMHPAIGAALGAAAAHKAPGILAHLASKGTALAKGVTPASNAGFTGLAALLGAGAGSIYNRATAGQRVEDMHQAIRGVRREMDRNPSAREAMPLVMSSNSGET